MATLEQLQAALVKADAAGNVDDARQLAAAIRASMPKKEAPPIIGGTNPADVSGMENFFAGAGKAIVDTGRGLAQVTSLNGRLPWGMTPEEYDAVKQRDAPLMDTGAGLAGNVVGNLATMIGPGAAVGGVGLAAKAPGLVSAAGAAIAPRTALGALVQGLLVGGAQPVGSDDSRLMNAGIGGVASAAIPVAMAGGSAIKAAVQPFTEQGRQAIAGRVLQRFATDPNSIAGASTQGLVPGSMPTLAEATQDTGLAQLQRSLMNNPDAAAPLAARDMANNAARVNAVQDIAGDATKREFFAADRATVAKDLYDKAFAENPTLTPWIKGQITQLGQRPAMKDAFEAATERAANEGVKLNPENAVQVLHYAKMELDDMIGKLKAAGQDGKAASILGIKDKLTMVMESKDFAPAYREARATYAEMSKPINQMDVGQALADKLSPAINDFGGNTRMTANSFANALRNGDQPARKATGFSGATLENTLAPDQLKTVTNVAKELAARANAQELGLAKGSPTAQNLISQNLLRQILGPLGLPQSWAEAVIPLSAMRPLQWAAKMPEKELLQTIANAALDPATAQSYVAKAAHRGAISRGADAAVPSLVTLADMAALTGRTSAQ